MLRAGTGFFVVRGDKNATFRRADRPPYSGRGRRPTRRTIVRPLPRKHKNHEIPADEPDREESWPLEDGRTVFVKIWSSVFLPESVLTDEEAEEAEEADEADEADEAAQPSRRKRLLDISLTVLLVSHPDFNNPMVLVTNMNQTPVPTICAIYPDRWPIEMIPLSAKHMIGAHRQFVYAPEHTQRLPELALLAGNVLSCVAATAQPVSTGFWEGGPPRGHHLPNPRRTGAYPPLAACAEYYRRWPFEGPKLPSLVMSLCQTNFAKRILFFSICCAVATRQLLYCASFTGE